MSDDTTRKLNKAFEQKIDTSADLQPWEERFERRTSVASSKSQLAAEVISNRGLGSWAAQTRPESSEFYIGGGGFPAEVPGDSNVQSGKSVGFSKLGQAGLPEIDFVPYHWNTHANGTKGPSLIGHPISFSVWGPTLKSPYCDWQWRVIDNSGLAIGDYLIMATGPFGSPTASSIDQAYQDQVVQANGGAYLYIPMAGSDLGMNLGAGDGPLEFDGPHGERALFELFRIKRLFGLQGFELEPNKRLADYFEFNYTDHYVRAITIIIPEATRLVAIPGSGPVKGREQVYAVAPPEVSLNSDLYPPWRTWDSTLGGEADVWNGHVNLPLPVPSPLDTGYIEYEGVVEPSDTSPPNSAIGLWRIHNVEREGGFTLGPSAFTANDVGKVIQVHYVRRYEADQPEDTTYNRDLKSVMGWFEIFDYGYAAGTFDNFLVLKRIAEVNPETGEIFYGPGPHGISATTDTALVKFKSYDPISELWMSALPDVNKIDAARLTNLINPEWVGRSMKSEQNTFPGTVRDAYPDRAIFDTSVSGFDTANPGSLLDLGYRMVLFPGKVVSGLVVPDFDKPIDSRNVVIDPTITDEDQYLDIDYSAGIVRLSHPPPASDDSDSDIRPNPLGGSSNNPRNELVLFASCVPYSMEPGQTGPGVRLRVGDSASRLGGTKQERTFSDPYSSQVWLTVRATQSPTPYGDSLIVEFDTEGKFPETGFAEVHDGIVEDPYGNSEGTIGWYRKGTTNIGGTDYTTLEGVYPLPGYSGGSISIGSNGGLVTLRRDVEAPYLADTAYGAAVRASSVNLAYGEVTFNEDGSVTLLPTAVAGPAQELRANFPLGISTKKDITRTDVGRVHLDSTTQQWTFTTSPGFKDQAEIGMEISRGRLFASMNLDLGIGFNFQRWVNRATSLTRSVAGKITSRWSIDLDTHSSGFVLDGMMDYPPGSGVLSPAGNMCACIEGTTVSSAEESSWGAGLVADQRILVNIKKFFRRSSRDDNANEMKAIDEGPSNPLDWLSYTAVGGEDSSDIATYINSFYSSGGRSASAANSTGHRVNITERQVSILPSKPYLESRVMTGIGGGPDMKYVLTVYSADPREATRKRWITFEATVPGPFAVPSPSSPTWAQMLNAPLYDQTDANYIGNELNAAGFLPDSSSGVSANPWLSTAPMWDSERQFLWIGNDDPRHPNPGQDTVCLLCGGYGVTDDQNTPFYCVMVEFGATDGGLSYDVTSYLREDFSVTTVDPIQRCGLFYGPDADDLLTNLATPSTILTAFTTNREATEGNGNTTIGFHPSGVEPLGFLCGSFPIEGWSASQLDIRLPTGTSQFYQGPRTSTTISGDLVGYGALNWSKDSLRPMEASKTNEPYLGRWVWHQFDRSVIDLSVGSEAGLSHIYVTYKQDPHDERGFQDYFTGGGGNGSRGHGGHLLYAYSIDEDLDSPQVAEPGILKGDLLQCWDDASPRTGRELSWRGVVVDPTVDLAGWVTATPPPRFSMAVMVRPGGFPPLVRDRDHVFTTSLQPEDVTTIPQFWSGGYQGTSFATSVLPNPNAVTLSASFRNLYPHTEGPSTFAKYSSFVIGPEDGSGLDGGYSTFDETGVSNAVIIGGGRAEFVNMLGPDIPTGLSFSSPVVGSENTGIRFANTFLEHGVFTSSVSLGSQAIEGAGLFDAYRVPERELGRVKGQSVGGTAGLRVSGDAQLWLTNLRALVCESRTAFIRERTTTSLPTSFPANKIGTGPVTSLGEDPGSIPPAIFSPGQGTLGSGAHIPSGYSPGRTRVGTDEFYVQEATVSLALTRPDYTAFMAAVGRMGPSDTVLVQTGAQFALNLGQYSRIGDVPIPVPFLQGCFLKLETGIFASPSGNEPANVGVWRIVGAPMLTSTAIADVIAPSSASFDELHQYSPFSLLRTAFNSLYLTPGVGTDIGNSPPGAIVAYLQVRVERLARVHLPSGGLATETFYPETMTDPFLDGHPWGFYEDQGATRPIYVADVVDPGGSPTGAPSGLSGLTINPAALGNRSTLMMDLVSVFTETDCDTASWPLVGRSTLYGVHESLDHRGRKVSQAFFSMTTGSTPTSNLPRNAYARAVIYSSIREDRLDDVSMANTKGEFAVDAAGRVSFVGHPARLGLGIVLDGGLGSVQATAFRATPRPEVTDTIASLTVWGHNAAHPALNLMSERSNIAGVSMPSSFNKVEFYDDVTVVGPNSKLVFESARASMGLAYNLRANIAATDADYNPAQLGYLRSGDNSDRTLGPFPFGFIRMTPNDTLFPFSCVGIKFRTPGGVLYERPFRPVDATGTNNLKSSFEGRASESGIKGLEIPAFGECLLCPKGPPTIQGQGHASWTWTSGQAFGNTPLDLPLYEFTNGYGLGHMTPFFGINPGPIFNHYGVGASPSHVGSVHPGNPGSVASAYRHSQSIQDGTVMGYHPLYRSEFDVEEQVRVLPGMVLEDIDNGTFYTIGDVGRNRQYYVTGVTPSYMTSGLGQLGNAVDRPWCAGDVICSAGTHDYIPVTLTSNLLDGDTLTITLDGKSTTVFTARLAPGALPEFLISGTAALTAGWLASAINGWYGSTAGYVPVAHAVGTKVYLAGLFPGRKFPPSGYGNPRLVVSESSGGRISLGTLSEGYEPEICFDLGPQVDPIASLATTSIGYGDRDDPTNTIRRPLKGHRFRITPNVEFVPVLGPRGLDGGLLPPLTPSWDSDTLIDGADAIFYSGAYDFKHPASFPGEGDIGRFLYICGTEEYRYTGWWIIIDVLEGYNYLDGPLIPTRDVAVLRKWRRGDEDKAAREVVSTTQYDVIRGLPIPKQRIPLIRMTADYLTNDAVWDHGLFYGPDTTQHSDLYLEVTDSSGANLYNVQIPAAQLDSGGVVDCVTLASFCNGDVRTNGANIPGGFLAGSIVWVVEENDQFEHGASCLVTYRLGLMTDVQKDQVLGKKATLRVTFFSNTGSITAPYSSGTHSGSDHPTAIGFFSYRGSNQAIDRCVGERNNYAVIQSPSPLLPNTSTVYRIDTTARGLRWVFSAPLTEENVGSFMHLGVPKMYRFGHLMNSQDDLGVTPEPPPDYRSWLSGYARAGDDDALAEPRTEIYRVNRCPNTGDLILGGDCETYFPEIIRTGGTLFGTQKGVGVPIMYSPLGPGGLWANEASLQGFTDARHYPIFYGLQPIAREKILTVSPRQMASSPVLGRGEILGPQGVSGMVVGGDPTATDLNQTASLALEKPWKLIDRYTVTRTRIAPWRTLLNGWYATQYGILYSDEVDLNNANTLYPDDPGLLPVPDSDYIWAPAGEWWQLYWPHAYQQSYQYNASCPPPTLRVDLTETFTQAMQAGGGLNTPYRDHAPRGVRLTKIWVNFGIWGVDVGSTADSNALPGFGPGLDVDENLFHHYMAFNLVVEIPGSQSAEKAANDHPLGSGTAGFPFGDRAPNAIFNHSPTFHTDPRVPGGTVVVPLYCNREAGDLMPNVMEKFVTGGPRPVYNTFNFPSTTSGDPAQDWSIGHYEYGFGNATLDNNDPYHLERRYFSSSFNTILWGGADYYNVTDHFFGWAVDRQAVRSLAAPHARQSRVSGGTRSAFTSGLVPNGSVFQLVPSEGLSAPALTGIVVAHAANAPWPPSGEGGSLSVNAGPANENHQSPPTCSHAFTIGLTPVGDYFPEPDPSSDPQIEVSGPALYGRELNPAYGLDDLGGGVGRGAFLRTFKVGNWLDNIIDTYGMAAQSGSMLPPGARVFLEISAGPGPGASPDADPWDEVASGAWVGSVKVSFEVETADGTAYSLNVNTLGHEE